MAPDPRQGLAVATLPALPAPIEAQLWRVHGVLRAVLGQRLQAVYLHGSLAMGCFNPQRSDLDGLAVVKMPLSPVRRRALARRLLSVSNAPRPVELSVLHRAALEPWHHPAPYEFHYSESWRDCMERAQDDPHSPLWNDSGRIDPDLAAHLAVTRARGLTLQGPPPEIYLPAIPAADYRAAILADVAEAPALMAVDPVYATLNLCRVLQGVRTGAISSKAEGGCWAATALPPEQGRVAAAALSVYRGERDARDLAPDDLQAFVGAMQRAITDATG